jgi:hypothetical protein
MNKLQAFHLTELDAVHLQNELPMPVIPTGRLLAPLPPVGKQHKIKCSGGLLIAMGVLVNNTLTKANNLFGPYRDDEAELTHGLHQTFA